MALGQKTGGRKPGSTNKITSTAKENICAVFTRLGGYEAMTKWARDNETEFYKIYARLIPVEAQVTGADGGPLVIESLTRTVIDPAK